MNRTTFSKNKQSFWGAITPDVSEPDVVSKLHSPVTVRQEGPRAAWPRGKKALTFSPNSFILGGGNKLRIVSPDKRNE
jgi:hypothetical protein